MPLNPRQQRFVELYLSGLTAEAAYQQAGYTCTAEARRRNASRLLTNADVKAAVDAANARALERQELTADWVIGRLKHEATLTGEGSSHSARVRAIELLGKKLRLFADKVELVGPADGPVQFTVYVPANDRDRPTPPA